MAATSQPPATGAAAQVLSAGGTAADAAVAAAAALQVTQACSTGLGGDAFFLYYEASSGTVHALNGSGRSPKALGLEQVRADGFDEEIPSTHPHAVTVPGAARAWQDLLDRFGGISRERVLGPAVRLAEQGFPMSPMTAGWWRAGAEAKLSVQPNGRELLLDGRGPQAGEVMRLPTLAKSLRSFAEEGAAPFYTGRIADEIVSVLAEAGGVMSREDLAEHQSEWVDPICLDYNGARIYECPPNGQGLAALIAFNVLRHLDLPGSRESRLQRPADRAQLYHYMIESMRVGFAEGNRHIADPEFYPVPVAELLSSDYGARRAANLNPDRRATTIGPAADVGTDTVYFCVVDAEGNACSFINSNYQGFGTGIVPRGCGFSLQNRGKGFRLDSTHPNALEPGKRPYHTIIPGMALRSDGSLLAPFGVMGGFMQPQGHLQVIQALVDEGIDPQGALDRPRFQIADADPEGAVLFESESDPEVAAHLSEKGHDIRPVSGRRRYVFGLGQIILRDERGILWGGSDPRGDGCAQATMA